MNWIKMQNSGRILWTLRDIAREIGITEKSARVLASRYVKKNWLTRVKNNCYLLHGRLSALPSEELFYLSNLLQTPSYISLTTALAFWGATTQLLQGVIEAVSPYRATRFGKENIRFQYQKISPKLYNGFIRQGKFFIATREKALLDAVYLTTLNRYALDFSALEKAQFSRKDLWALAKSFPRKTQEEINRLFP